MMPPLASLITLAASALFVITDQHLEVLRALVQSYDVLVFGANLDQRAEMINILGALASASLLSLQVCSPFLVFGITINFVFGILNKLAPQIPVYFISAPFVIGGGLMLLYFLSDDTLAIFMFQFSGWLRQDNRNEEQATACKETFAGAKQAASDQRLELQVVKDATRSGTGRRTEGDCTAQPGGITNDPFQLFGSQGCFLGSQDQKLGRPVRSASRENPRPRKARTTRQEESGSRKPRASLEMK